MSKVRDQFEMMFPKSVRTVISSSIYTANQWSKELKNSLISLPMRGSLFAGHAFPIFIDKIMASQIDKLEVGNFPYDYGEHRIPKCGYPYVEYHSPFGKFHIKKLEKAEKLPKAAVHRLSNSVSNLIFLELGDEYIPPNLGVPFGLVTYGHYKFDLTFIQVGFPTADYKEWADNKRWSIVDDVSKEMVEEIRHGAAGQIKEEFQETILKKFTLKVKGE